jgi:hypothetical protein
MLEDLLQKFESKKMQKIKYEKRVGISKDLGEEKRRRGKWEVERKR